VRRIFHPCNADDVLVDTGDLHGAGGYLHQYGSYRPIPELAQYKVPGSDNFTWLDPSCIRAVVHSGAVV
jgi:hypothetical protein